MPDRYRLTDVNPRKLSLVKQGANGKRFCIRKSAGDAGEQAELERTLIVKSDWSAVYCVVAEPGAVENGGLLAPDVEDVWDADEIRKACHTFARNGGVIDLEHIDGTDGSGTMVENALAHHTFDVTDPSGQTHTISKGSWYVAIEPDTKLRKSIEDGDITGVSVDGDAIRTLITKASYEGAKKCPGCSSKVATDKATCPNCNHSFSKVKKESGSMPDRLRNFLKSLGAASGMSEEQLAELDEVQKSTPTFDGLMAERELNEEMPQAFDAFREVIWLAFRPYPEDADDDPRDALVQSSDQFKSWLLALYDRAKVQKSADGELVVPAELAKALGDPPDSLNGEGATVVAKSDKEEDVALTTEERKEFDELKTSVGESTELLKTLGEGVTALLEKQKAAEKPEPPSPEDLKKSLDDTVKAVGDLLEPIAKGIEALSDGGPGDGGPDRQQVEKSNGNGAIGLLR